MVRKEFVAVKRMKKRRLIFRVYRLGPLSSITTLINLLRRQFAPNCKVYPIKLHSNNRLGKYDCPKDNGFTRFLIAL